MSTNEWKSTGPSTSRLEMERGFFLHLQAAAPMTGPITATLKGPAGCFGVSKSGFRTRTGATRWAQREIRAVVRKMKAEKQL